MISSPTQLENLIQDYLSKYPDPEKIADLSESTTEQSNPKTQQLSDWAKHSPVKALQAILEVEQEALLAFLTHTSERRTIHQFIQTAQQAKRLFLVGCGASGRIVMLIERLIKDLRTQHSPPLQIVGVPAGGDIALVNSISEFEDSPVFAIQQLIAQGYQAGDPIIGLSANGAATFVLAALQYAQQHNSQGLLLTCNSTERIIHRANTLKKTTLFQNGIPERLSIVTFDLPAPALAGSTRMHPTTILLLACQNLLTLFDARYQDSTETVEQLMIMLKNLPLEALGKLCRIEQSVYAAQEYILYRVQEEKTRHPGLTAFSIFTDLTERNPTFNLPPLGTVQKLGQDQASWFWLSLLGSKNAETFWSTLLQRPPFYLNIPDFPVTTLAHLLSCDFSESATQLWASHCKPYHTIDWIFNNNHLSIRYLTLSIDIPLQTLSPFAQQILIKIILNACSTTTFAASRCHHNWMTHLSPTNLKLIQRMERIQQILATDRHPSLSLKKVRENWLHTLRYQNL